MEMNNALTRDEISRIAEKDGKIWMITPYAWVFSIYDPCFYTEVCQILASDVIYALAGGKEKFEDHFWYREEPSISDLEMAKEKRRADNALKRKGPA